VSILVGILVMAGVFPATDATQVEGFLDTLVAALMNKDTVASALAAIPVFTYVMGRIKLKAQHAQANETIAAIVTNPAVIPVPAPPVPAVPASPPPSEADPFKV
jgi:uncharacterized membrane protein YoaK (UPF0700 family)